MVFYACVMRGITRRKLRERCRFFLSGFLYRASLLKASNHLQHPRFPLRAAVAFVFTMTYRRSASLEFEAGNAFFRSARQQLQIQPGLAAREGYEAQVNLQKTYIVV